MLDRMHGLALIYVLRDMPELLAFKIVQQSRQQTTVYAVPGGQLNRTLLSTGSRVHSYSELHEAVILPYCMIGRGARLSRVVVDRGVSVPDGLVIGEDPEFDGKWFRRTEEGITLVTQPMIDKYLASR